MRYAGLIMVLVLSIGASSFAQGQKVEKNIIARRSSEIIGEISAIGKDFIAIVYKRDEKIGTEYEISLPIDSDTTLKNKKSLSDLNVGDTVRIQYEDRTLKEDSGENKMERKAEIVTFVRQAVKKPQTPQPPEPGD